MKDAHKFILAAGILGIALWLGNKAKQNKKSSFVDENLSEAEGKKELPAGIAKKKYRPDSWARVGKNWVWVNGEGNLVITDGE